MRRLVAAVATVALALTGVLLSAPANAEAHAKYRIAGSDRYATSAEVSRLSSWSGNTVFLASGASFPDALAAAPVVAAERAHFMLTDPSYLPAPVRSELLRLAPSEIVIVGGAASVSEAVVRELSNMLPATITRIGGTDRVHTSMLLLDRLRQSGPVSSIWVVSGRNFPDALVAGSVAGRDRAGILLNAHGASDAESAAWVDRVQPYFGGMQVNVAGGNASISAWVEQRMRYTGAASVTRYAGSNRYETAVAIHNTFSRSAAESTMALASGENFPDALSGASYAAVRGFPLFLTPSQCNDTIAAMLRNERDRRAVGTVVGFGGTASLSERSLNLEGCPPPPPPPPVVQPPVQGPPPPPPGPAVPSNSVRCADFPTQSAAQTWWRYWRDYGGFPNPGGLDGDGDGRVCEHLPR